MERDRATDRRGSDLMKMSHIAAGHKLPSWRVSVNHVLKEGEIIEVTFDRYPPLPQGLARACEGPFHLRGPQLGTFLLITRLSLSDVTLNLRAQFLSNGWSQTTQDL